MELLYKALRLREAVMPSQYGKEWKKGRWLISGCLCAKVRAQRSAIKDTANKTPNRMLLAFILICSLVPLSTSDVKEDSSHALLAWSVKCPVCWPLTGLEVKFQLMNRALKDKYL